MGGSSLAPEVFRQSFGELPDGLRLHVLDSTDPGAILAVERSIDLAKTLFIVSSKSGGTIETMSQFRYFHGRVRDAVGDEAGKHFVAITDPGTSLADLAEENGFLHTFLNDPDIGGRYSALSYFGMVPAALMGAEPKPGEFDMFNPANVAPLVAWLASDDAAGVNGQVFRVGGRSVWPMKGWHSATRIKNPEPAPWEPAKLGARIKEELAKGITAPEGMGDVFAGGL